MASTLNRILADTRRGLPELWERRAELESAALARPLRRRFSEALRGPAVAVIGELKRRSPSAGVIAPALDPPRQGRTYAQHGASAISVLTDAANFGGSVRDLAAVADAVALPLLRKDFILDEVQVIEARAAGASAVLLIVRALGPENLRLLLDRAHEWGLEALVEVHETDELDVALDAGARVIGVNSRDLRDYRIDTATAWKLLGKIPREVIAVAESGIHDPEGVSRAATEGADAVLIGTALSASPDPGSLMATLVGIPRCAR
jgi:indole-3-glycerol phosphate synthase